MAWTRSSTPLELNPPATRSRIPWLESNFCHRQYAYQWCHYFNYRTVSCFIATFCIFLWTCNLAYNNGLDRDRVLGYFLWRVILRCPLVLYTYSIDRYCSLSSLKVVRVTCVIRKSMRLQLPAAGYTVQVQSTCSATLQPEGQLVLFCPDKLHVYVYSTPTYTYYGTRIRILDQSSNRTRHLQYAVVCTVH